MRLKRNDLEKPIDVISAMNSKMEHLHASTIDCYLNDFIYMNISDGVLCSSVELLRPNGVY